MILKDKRAQEITVHTSWATETSQQNWSNRRYLSISCFTHPEANIHTLISLLQLPITLFSHFSHFLSPLTFWFMANLMLQMWTRMCHSCIYLHMRLSGC